MTCVEVDEVTRVFEQRKRERIVALDDLSLAIEEGEIHGLLGPNGAGKTTLVKILSTVLLPTSGRARVLGRDVVAETDVVRRLIGIVFGGERGLYPRLTGRQNLLYWGALYRLPTRLARERADSLLARVGLEARGDQKVEDYSRGMKQRLHLVRGLMGDARVLFLDEPTLALDPVAARGVRDLVAAVRAEGRTILLTTHDMREAEAICDRVTLIDRGRVLATESPRTLVRLRSRFQRIEAEGADDHVLAEIRALPDVRSMTRADGHARIEVEGDEAARDVLGRLVAAGVVQVRTATPTLEEVYVELVAGRGGTP